VLISIAKAFLPPLVVAAFAAQLASTWQYRAWRIQQRQAGATRDYESLHKLWEKLDKNASSRLFATKGLLSALEPGSTLEIQESKSLYRLSIQNWNEDLYAVYNQCTLLLSWPYTLRIESSIHFPLVYLTRDINEVLRSGKKMNWSQIRAFGDTLQSIRISFRNLSRDILKEVEIRRSNISDGQRLEYHIADLHKMSVWQLIKLLFVSDVRSLDIRSPL